jgi:hypothetical protein
MPPASETPELAPATIETVPDVPAADAPVDTDREPESPPALVPVLTKSDPEDEAVLSADASSTEPL